MSSSEKMDVDGALASSSQDALIPPQNQTLDAVAASERNGEPTTAAKANSDYPLSGLVTGRNDNSTFPHPSLMRTDSLQNLLRPTPVRYDSVPSTAQAKLAPPPPSSAPPMTTTQQPVLEQRPSSSASAAAGGGDRALNVTDALSYLDSVKMQFQDQPDVYNHFLDIMKDFKSQVIDTPGVINRVSHLFRGHLSLIQGFNTFLPVGYRIETYDNTGSIIVTTPTGTMTKTSHLPLANGGSAGDVWVDSSSGANPPASGHPPVGTAGGMTQSQLDALGDIYETEAIEPAVQYVQKIKQRCDPEVYRQFLDILSRYHQSPMEIDEEQVSMQISQLFKDAPDLRSDFRVFMPDKGQGSGSQALLAGTVAPSRIGTPSSIAEGKPSRRRAAAPVTEPVTLPQKRKRKAVDKDSSLPGVGMSKSMSSGSVAKKARTQSNQDLTPSSFAPHVNASTSRSSKPALLQHASYQGAQSQAHHAATSFERHTHNQSLSQADDKHFFDRVKRALESREVYKEFLKLVNLFTQNYIDTGRLVKESRSFLGDGELMKQFRAILGWDERKEHDHRVAEYQQQMFYGFNPLPGGKVCTGEPGTVRTLPGRVEQSKLYGSYRRLPASEMNVPCSGRDEMCKSVLNDEWVSHPTWASEDTGFFTNKKNIYEEALHRSEEERHEYDFHIEAIARTITMLEPINNKIAQLNADERNVFKLKPNLGGSGKSIHHRVIKKIYGREPGLEVIKAMQETPALAIPVVLQRLKQKEEEWKRAQREWNKVWREVDARNYYKSLDHQAVVCKAADKKAITTKTFVSQIEAIRDEQHAKRASLIDPLFARTKTRYQLEFKMDDIGVLQDVLKLTFSFLDRTQSQYNEKERRRVEVFLRSFIPLFLGMDPVAFQSALTVPGAPVAVSQNGHVQNGTSASGTDGDMSDDTGAGVDDGDDSSHLHPSGAGSSTASKGRGGRRASGVSPANSGGDMRKKLLKSEQAKSTAHGGRKTRASQDAFGSSPAASRFSSPAVFDSMDGLLVDLASLSQAERSNKKRLLPFFCNTVFYVLLRLIETLYSRLELFKTVTANLVAEQKASSEPRHKIPASFAELNHLGEPATHAENFYGLVLESCEKLFDNEIEQHAFENQMRFMLGMKYAYKAFSIDKLIGALIKQVHAVFGDPRSQDLLENLKRLRAIALPNAQDLNNNRRTAEQILGLEESLFRLDWVATTQTMTMQILGGDDTSYEDTETLTARWRVYLDSYVASEETEGVPRARMQRPFLRKNLKRAKSGQPPKVSANSFCGLEIKICLRTYRIFYVPFTGDYLYRKPSSQEGKDALELLDKKNEARRKWMEELEASQGTLPDPAKLQRQSQPSPAAKPS